MILEAPERSCKQTKVDNDGIHFASCQRTSYLSLNYHRSRTSTTNQKSLWQISREDECHTFCTAESKVWRDPQGNYWSVADSKASDFGTMGERLAFFPLPSNAEDSWHGFPVTTRRGVASNKWPPDDLVDKWHESGRISYTESQRILTRRR